MRNETRRERYENKQKIAIKMPVSLVCFNFDFDDNLAFVIRTAACYGATNVIVIGTVPSKTLLRAKSGTTVDFVDILHFRNPNEFLEYCRKNDCNVISAELSDNSTSIHDFGFNLDKHTMIVLGHETIGIPTEISINSKNIFIPMPGIGYCLNTSQTGTAFLHEYSRQFLKGS